MPPLLVNNLFILNCREKARYFNYFCSQQCELVINNTVLPTFFTDERINYVTIDNDQIISLIRKIDRKIDRS